MVRGRHYQRSCLCEKEPNTYRTYATTAIIKQASTNTARTGTMMAAETSEILVEVYNLISNLILVVQKNISVFN